MKKIKDKKEKLSASSPEEVVCVESSDKEEMVCSRGGGVVKVEAKEPPAELGKKKGNVFVGTINFFAAPYQGLKESYEKKYGQARKLFFVDLILLGVIGLLFGFNVYLFSSKMSGNFSWFDFTNTTVGDGVFGTISESLLKTEMKINGEVRAVLNPGEDLEYVILYSNGGSKDIYDVAIKVDLEGAPIDLNQFSSEHGALRNGAVVWTKDQIPDFAKLTPGTKGELKFKVSTGRIAEPAKALKFEGVLKSWLEISYKLESGFGESHNFKTTVREDKFNSDLVLESAARYYTPEGDQLGLGPLPPKVGEKTTYWIFWSVNNNLNDLGNVSASAILPPNVSWTGRMSVNLGQLTYNSARRQVNWRVGEVERYLGEDWPKRGVAFEVILVPTVEQVGSEPELIGQIKIFGDDKFTGEFLEREGVGLTTNLIYDSLAGGKNNVAK
ncbi:hypothetical protein KKD80_03065 [Patescibacteria group bacterium]|nr:hypothetical protein [Patescibacteria group bacterium]